MSQYKKLENVPICNRKGLLIETSDGNRAKILKSTRNLICLQWEEDGRKDIYVQELLFFEGAKVINSPFLNKDLM